MELPLNQVICGNSLEILKTFPSSSIDLIITDPPYKREYQYLWKPLGVEAMRLLKDGSSLLTLCGHYQLPRVINDLLESGLTYYWCCAIWNHQEPYFFKNQLKVTWKPLLWFAKGKIPKHKTLLDGIKPTGAEKEFHAWGQSESFARDYIEALTTEKMVVVDPFLGGGTVCVVAQKLRRNWIGIDNDQKACEIARERLAQKPLSFSVNRNYQ